MLTFQLSHMKAAVKRTKFMKFFKPREDPAELLEFAIKAFDQVVLFVDTLVIFTKLLPIGFGRNNRNDSPALRLFDQLIAIIGFVHQCISGFYAFNQGISSGQPNESIFILTNLANGGVSGVQQSPF